MQIAFAIKGLMEAQPLAYAVLSVLAIAAFSLAAYGVLAVLTRFIVMRR